METVLKVTASDDVEVQDNRFAPKIPKTLEETGINEVLLDDLIFKLLLNRGVLSGRRIAQEICLPFKILEKVLQDLKNQMLLGHRSTIGLNDFTYFLTEEGRKKAVVARNASAYIGAAPVPFNEYLESVERQSIAKESPNCDDLKRAFGDLILESSIIDTLGPALNSGRGVFLHGNPGNGKTSIAKRIYKCFREEIYIPKTLLIEGQLIKLFDPQCHEPTGLPDKKPINHDQRWIRIKRPAVIVGGEMDLSSVEINYNPSTKLCEAPMQLKANCGIFVVDDFGRQRIKPADLLNRWILPLEKRIDFLTLPNGIKVQVPFDELVIFCTNIDPKNLLDEAFLRRIPYKIRVHDPSPEQFKQIMTFLAPQYGVECDDAIITYILEKHFNGKRPMRCCHPRDILDQVVNAAAYQRTQPILTRELIDFACKSYFTAMESVQ